MEPKNSGSTLTTAVNIESSPMSRAMVDMGNAIDNVFYALNTLEEKLSPISNPGLQDPDSEMKPSGQSPVVSELIRKTALIAKMAQRIEYMTNAVEL